MKIAMLGSRGIPARYSGVETCVENLAVRLAQRNHEVTVYCRPHVVDWPDSLYKGVRLIKIPTLKNKFLDTFVHTALCTIHMSILTRPDVALYSIAGNSPFVLLARMAGIRTTLNVDGFDSQRAKWGARARQYLHFAEWLSARVAHRTITDSRVVQRFYAERFNRPSTFIAYGAEVPESNGTEFLEQFGLRKDDYILVVKRLVPENNVHTVIDAYKRAKTPMPLVVVGDSPYEDDYVASLHAMAGPQVIFTGFVFGEGYHQLLHNAYLFVEPSEVGGTHPALIEAMAAGKCIIVKRHEPHIEALGETGLTFEEAEDLSVRMQEVVDNREMARGYGARSKERAHILYSWESVTDAYEQLCQEVVTPPRSNSRSRCTEANGLRD